MRSLFVNFLATFGLLCAAGADVSWASGGLSHGRCVSIPGRSRIDSSESRLGWPGESDVFQARIETSDGP